ncbi:glycosyl transferase [Blakeslea trispora]|nr:glycosyl transferase [Blakeslea trispora]
MLTLTNRILQIFLCILVALSLLFLSSRNFVHRRSQDADYSVGSSIWQHENPTKLKFPHDRFKAAFVTFAKNDSASLTSLRMTVRNSEDQFNSNHQYPYIIFTDQTLSAEYRELASSLIADPSQMIFERVGPEFYGYRGDTDLERAATTRESMANIVSGDSEDYRFLSRFMAGTIFKHPLVQELDYMWRFEIGTEYICPMDKDPFEYMQKHNKSISFSIALYEFKETIPSLYQTTLEFAQHHPAWIQPKADPKSLWKFVLNSEDEFNACHFWNNFQAS